MLGSPACGPVVPVVLLTFCPDPSPDPDPEPDELSSPPLKTPAAIRTIASTTRAPAPIPAISRFWCPERPVPESFWSAAGSAFCAEGRPAAGAKRDPDALAPLGISGRSAPGAM